MRYRKPLAAIAAATALAVLMGGCSTAAEPEGPVTITVWNGFAATENEALVSLIDKYWTNPNIKVEVQGEKTPEAILTAMTGSDSPDVVIAAASEFPSSWYKAGAIRDLTSLTNGIDGLDSQLVAAGLQWGRDGDTTFALPFVNYDWGMFYNKKLFAAAGLDPNAPPTTIDELEAYAKKLTIVGGDGQIEQLGWVPAQDISSATALAMAFGAKFVDADRQPTIDEPAIEQALGWDAALAASFGREQVQAFTSGFTSGDSPFSLGKAAMYIDGSWAASMLKDSGVDFGYAAIPAVRPAFADSTPVGTNPLVIPKAAKHVAAAEEFVKFMTLNADVSSEFAAAIANIPQVTSVLSSYSEDPAVRFFAELSGSANARAWAPVPYAADYSKEYVIALGRVYASGDDPRAALADAQKTLERVAAGS